MLASVRDQLPVLRLSSFIRRGEFFLSSIREDDRRLSIQQVHRDRHEALANGGRGAEEGWGGRNK